MTTSKLASPVRNSAGSYRPDIDGLRGLAILPVVLYHAGYPMFSGGFVGVDVFFVISGFLITSLILKQLHAGEFTFVAFWCRRARRILPALALVVLFVLVCGWIAYFPSDYKGVGREVLTQTFFASNVYFWLSSGYFAAPSETKPLLHTWSLSVEEQFYLLMPLLLVAAADRSSERVRGRACAHMEGSARGGARFRPIFAPSGRGGARHRGCPDGHADR